MNMNRIILVPTDFSENALLATRFAVGLATHAGLDVCVLHAFRPFRSAFQQDAVNDADREGARQEASTQMAAFLENFSGSVKPLEAALIEENLSEAIDSFLSERDVAVVVMGTTGASGVKHHLLGSNTFAIASTLKQVPLIVVPPGTTRFLLDKIAFFTDFNQGDLSTVSLLHTLFHNPGSTIQLIHFGRPEEREAKEEKLGDWARVLETKADLQTLPFRFIAGQEGVEAVEQLDEDFDLLALTLVEHGFFERLFSKSMARELIHQSKLPVFLASGLS